jgi:hypothetical protein
MINPPPQNGQVQGGVATVPGEVLICVLPGFWQTVVVWFTLVHEGLPEALVAMARAAKYTPAKNVAATNITVRSAIPAIGTLLS